MVEGPEPRQPARCGAPGARRPVIPGGCGPPARGGVPRGYPQFFVGGEGATVEDATAPLHRLHVRLGADHPRPPPSGGVGGGPARAGARRLPRRPDAARGRPGRDTWWAMIPHADWAMFQKNGSDAMTDLRDAGPRRDRTPARCWPRAAPITGPSPGARPPRRRHRGGPRPPGPLPATQRRREPGGGGGAGGRRPRGDPGLGLPARYRPGAGTADPSLRGGGRAACDRTGAALVVDDVRAGFRLDLGAAGNGWACGPTSPLFQGDRQRPAAGRRHRQRSLPRGRVAPSSSPARSGMPAHRWRRPSRR